MTDRTEDLGDIEDAVESAGSVLDYPVVGVGASAGGIGALKKFFGTLPENPGMAFIVVLHLHPDHESHLADLLRKVTKLPLSEIEGDTPVERDRVYVITPKHALTLEDGTIRVNPAGESPRHPVDTLLRSLAKEQREKSVAVVLSGTGTDGTAGAIRIKEEGGAVFVQDPETAEYDGMPLSVIGAGVADRVLAPDAMPQELLDFAAHPYVSAPAEAARLQEGEGPPLEAILTVLRTRARYDFLGYKTTTLLRRIRRRMGLRRLDALGDYAAVLRDDPAEAEALVRDLLIGVTAFFRDHKAWEELENAVIEPLVREAEGDQPMRVWVPACSTGEEAYSIAMLLLDRTEAAGKQLDLKVFATDAAPHVLARARTGCFAASVAEEMPPERLARHFDHRGHYYQAKKQLRSAIVFAPQKLLHDPPFSRMDFVSCRNLLIYLEPEMQQKVIGLLHFSLREGGYLFLGTAESVGERQHMFRTVSKKWRIYRRVGPTRHDIVDFPLARTGPAPQEGPRGVPATVQGASERARRALIERFAPPSVLIDGHFRVHYFHGETERFLDQPRGEPSSDLLSLAKRGLTARLRAAVHRSMRDGEPVTVDARIEGPEPVPVRIVVAPLGEEGAPRRLLVSFLEAGAGEAPPAATIESDERLPGTERELEDALRALRAELRETVEQLESSNEGLQASNEEIISMNEELQSTNEELETSKEELQSLNEELNTVNLQLQNKVAELEERTNDLDNLLSSTNIATLFLDREMRIRFATPAVRELFEVRATDMGRPVSDLAQKFEDPDFVADAREVLRTLRSHEREVRTAQGGWFDRRIQPYRAEDRIDGVVVTFADVTERKRSEDEIAGARHFAESIVETVRHPLIVLDPILKVVSVNEAFSRTFRLSGDEAVGRWIYDLGGGQWDLPELRRLLEEILPHDNAFDGLSMAAEFPGLGHRDMLLNGRRLDHVQLILLAIEDVTERRRAERGQQALFDELQHRVKNLFANINAIMRMTSKGAGSVGEFVARLSDRLRSLERTQDLLSRDPAHGIDLRDLVAAEMEAHGAPNGQVEIEGEPVRLARRAAQAVAMAVHELATNGLKYGALAHGGHVNASWTRAADGRRLVFCWRETGVPGGVREIDGGFGSKLIREVVPYMLGGTSELEATEDGIRCVIEVPQEQEEDRTAPEHRDARGNED